MTTHNTTNRLANEKSPYLLQHAYNPVDWFPWSEEAFDIAKRDNKPIFLSIGYSTCHWCHVMERESFEDEEVAGLLNRDYISIKVDREERPDVDHIYMTVCQALTGQGGWPLTIVMTPDKKPFFAGTYFPKHKRYGRHGLMDLLTQLGSLWRNNPDKVLETGEQIVQEVEKSMLANLNGSISAETLDQAFEIYEQRFDPEYGGFGNKPKFPTSHNLSFLMRYYQRSGNEKALQMVEKTLDSMHRGGMYDHVGYGFSRYSVDEKWLVPHFEKMLYDNALLAWTYIEAYQLTGKKKYAEVAEQIFAYVLRDMTDSEGGFYSAEDADSEGEEGKFYVWSPKEIVEALGDEDGEWYCDLFDITDTGNFEGRGIPNLIHQDLETAASRKGLALHELKERVERCSQQLFAAREKRIHPGKDDKILTSWNGLMIMALAKASKALGNESYLQAAAKAAQFITINLRREDGRLLARYRDGEAAYPGYVDDYAFLVWGLIELYEAAFDIRYLKLAVELNAQMIDLFWDEERGGLYFYGNDGEQLISRNKEIYDGALPSGNSVAAMNLLKLSKLTYDAKLSRIADTQLEAFAGSIERYPAGHSMFLIALDFAYGPTSEIVIAGRKGSDEIAEMLEEVRSGFRPNAITVFVPDGAEGEEVGRLIPLVQDKRAIGGRATAYVCSDFACQSPTTDLEELRELLQPEQE
ncbi:thioredoxin domain-containing protein [Paenibacillus sp. H1-7]|uniref:thioredoxin domain-containing protein n=1 Tax=Paenibacillus sp. H1-7 TaxID=2282849 RepID=UPI001EF89F06|nr:thioredoxin domain-containing protein [Paenibacillus sp. H1-7]ULL19798.1 thioredoxin domain-containing protein [Paenibacillus sp. H1-7]